MNIEICKKCGNIKLLPLRYQCLKDNYYNCYKILNRPLLEETFFKHMYPKECVNYKKETRKKDVCSKCAYFKVEEQRYACKKVFASYVYENILNRIDNFQNCDYYFEQEMSELNDK